MWTEKTQRAFTMLRDALTSPPILAMPTDTSEFILDTDACDHTIGAVLSNVQDGMEKVIAYASRTLNKREMRASDRASGRASEGFREGFRQGFRGFR